jgi:hypothetical protein
MLHQKWSKDKNMMGSELIFGHVVSSYSLCYVAIFLLKTQIRLLYTKRYYLEVIACINLFLNRQEILFLKYWMEIKHKDIQSSRLEIMPGWKEGILKTLRASLLVLIRSQSTEIFFFKWKIWTWILNMCWNVSRRTDITMQLLVTTYHLKNMLVKVVIQAVICQVSPLISPFLNQTEGKIQWINFFLIIISLKVQKNNQTVKESQKKNQKKKAKTKKIDVITKHLQFWPVSMQILRR